MTTSNLDQSSCSLSYDVSQFHHTPHYCEENVHLLCKKLCTNGIADAGRYFRIVHAPIFLRSFASDRREMKDSAGNWIGEPTAYNPIVSGDGTVHNLNEYMEVHSVNMLTNVTSHISCIY